MAFFGVELNAQTNRLINNIKLHLNENKYMPNFRTIYKSFISYDPEQSGVVSTEKMDKALQHNGIFLKKFETQALQKAFPHDYRVNWFGLMSVLREPMNEYRSQVVEKVYDSIDPDNTGQIHYSELMKLFNASEFLEFKLKQKTKQKIEKEMFDLVPLNEEGCITKEQFINFYNDLSLNIINDIAFAKFVASHWNYELEKLQKTTSEQTKQAIRIIRFKMIQMTEGTHEEYILKRVFDEFDLNKNGSLCEEQLYTMLVKLQIPTQKRVIKPLLKKLDRNGNGVVEYDEFKNFLFFDPYPI